MPSEKILAQKQVAVGEVVEKLKAATAGVLVDYKGISVEKDSQLRRELREAGVQYTVIKNSILRRACEETGYEGLKDQLVGTTALALSNEDPVAPAKILAKYQKDLKDHFTIKAGFVDGRVIDSKEVDTLSNLPSREQLIAALLRSLNAPISGLASVLTGNMRGLVVALDQIAQKG